MEEFKNLKRVAMNEAKKLDAAYANKDEFNEADMKKFDCIMHGLKCLLTAEAMIEAEEYETEGVSGRRGRGANGRYVSRDNFSNGYEKGFSEAMSQNANNASFASGYNQGYSEAMSRGDNGNTSGHYPMMPYPQRRW